MDGMAEVVVEFPAVSVLMPVIRKITGTIPAGLPVKRGEIEGKQLPEDREIMSGELVDASLDLSSDLAGLAERVFVAHEKESKIRMPQISEKTVLSGKLRQLMQAEKPLFLPVIIPLLVSMLHQIIHLPEELSL